MLADFFVAFVLFVCFVCFASVNLHNILVAHKRKEGVKSVAEVEHPAGFVVSVAALGTGVYFVEAFLFQLLSVSRFALVCVLLFEFWSAALSALQFLSQSLSLFALLFLLLSALLFVLLFP